ncbi:pseudaminic acid synthase [Rhodoferax mekongensis]|uniref:pseudaminic acid synthase n=1 Tax=Rhodoferax mekongensis TaxID=3068341 RepID=UPI0028BDEB7C|nr:pseudaminic acid synthase [Rhodoferax sp. TBRC 17199]MDT7516801.1 pseudaminic acid synthase [Rhodoferax sp. TBRC 17199]
MVANTGFELCGRRIGRDAPPFVIAEMSGNHNQSLPRSLQIVEAAARSGAHALKIQTYTPDTMTLDLDDGDFFVADKNNLWHGTTLYKLYAEAHTPWEWHKAIFERAAELGMLAFSSPFDASAVDFLETLDVPCYKIASFENTDIQLIRKVAKTGKPMIISTGMATVAELGEAVAAARDSGCRDLVLLKCTSSYPAPADDTNIRTIPHMRELFGCEVGLSDHTMGVGVSVASVALGASVIEKHFTLARADGGVDSAFSLEPHEMRALVEESDRAWRSLGAVSYGPTLAERKSLKYRRGLRVVVDLAPGDVLTTANVRAIRPGGSLTSGDIDQILGRRTKVAVKRGTALSWNLIA